MTADSLASNDNLLNEDSASPGPGPWISARRLVLLLMSVLALAVAGTSLMRTIRTFYYLDFMVTWIEDGILIDEVPEDSTGDHAGLAPGDLIVMVDGAAIADLRDPLLRLAAGEEHQLMVRQSEGQVRELGYRPPAPRVDSVYLARSLVSIFALACALYAVFFTRRSEATTFLLLALASLMLSTIPHRTAATELSLQLLHRAAGTAVPLLTIRFFAMFPEQRRIPRLYDLLIVLAMGASSVITLAPEPELWWRTAAATLRVLFGLALLGGPIIHAWRWYRTIRVARIRRQIEWAALGMLVGLGPFAALVLLPQWLGIAFEPFSWLAVLPIVALPLGFLAALTEYRLWDLEPISRDALSATVVVAVGGFAFAATNHFLLARGGGALRNLLAFVTGVVLVVLLQPVRLRMARFLDQWLHHGKPTPRWLLTHATRDLARASDPRELLLQLSEALSDALEIELVATYVRDIGGNFCRISGDDLPEKLLAGDLTSGFPAPGEELIQSAGFAQRIPLERAGTVHGLLYLGLRRGIFPLGRERHQVVTAFAAQAALGLESARLLDDLRRQAEEYRILHANTQRIIDSSAAAILVCDATGRLLSVNARAASIFGEDRMELVGGPLESLVELPDSWHPELPLHAVNAEAETLGEEPRRVVMAVSVLELDRGSFDGRVVVLQDVTELRDLQDRLREQERLAALGRLTSGLAHEINTPLTGIASYAQMLGEMTPPGDSRAGLVSKLVDQSFRVSRIVANLREAVRGSQESGCVLDLCEVAARAARDAARSLAAGERLVVEPGPGRVMVMAEPGSVELAVGNLVRNAIEASPAAAKVHVAVLASKKWGEVQVDDSGPGVPSDQRERAFEAFFTTKTERGGTGLGLSITRDMITQLGGEVGLESRPQGGARARIRLPLVESTQE